MCGDDFLERHETIGVADPEPSGQRVRDLHPREEFALVAWIADDDRQVERQIRHIGERVTRVDSERCEHREDPVAEPLRQLSLVVASSSCHADNSIPCSRRAGMISWTRTRSCSATRSVTMSRTSASCSAGSRPSEAGVEMPAAC